MNASSLSEYLEEINGLSAFSAKLGDQGGYISFKNSGKRGGVKEFTISIASIITGLEDILLNINSFKKIQRYVEKEWRDAGGQFFSDLSLNSIVTVQTKPTFTTFSKVINWANNISSYDENYINLSDEYLKKAIKSLKRISLEFTPKVNVVKEHEALEREQINESTISSFVYKVLLLLIKRNKINKLTEYLEESREGSSNLNLSYKNKKLGGIFKVSQSALSEEDLISGPKIRYIDEPLVIDNTLYYLSTEWTYNKESRLYLTDFKSIVEDIYPEYNLRITNKPFRLFYRDKDVIRTEIKKQKLLPKPFLLLAGISGTGKTRFVREQAFDDLSNYQLVSVRPDWHEPSDLLGYVSRISGEEKYVTTDVLKFIAKAWRELIDSGVNISEAINNGHDTKTTIEGSSEDLEQIPPYWLCLDEMNLAPVEQYFADYLSVSETRKWSWQGDKFEYCCDPLLTSSTINDLYDKGDSLREALELTDSSYDELWSLFKTKGIAIPFNLMVAGTVNMDETTHGFSRKVIDRALSFDFGEFFPNDFQKFFEPDTLSLKLSYPVWSDGRDLEALSGTVDGDGSRTVNFLDTVNKTLDGTPFQLAFRALNEILLSVIANKPQRDRELMAVWDDFVMCKLLPRIEGDIDKLSSSQDDSEGTILKSLLVVLQGQLGEIWEGDARPDLYREYTTEQAHPENAPQEQSPSKTVWIPCRSKHKLEWMQQRLEKDTFTSFWP